MIDFEFILCDNPKYAPQLAIARDFQHTLEALVCHSLTSHAYLSQKEWKTFETIMAAGFEALRRNYSLISYLAQQMLGPIVAPSSTSFVPKLIAKQLMLDVGDGRATSLFIEAVNKASGMPCIFSELIV